MNYRNIEFCQHELEHTKSVLSYLTQRDVAIGSVFDTLRETGIHARDTCAILNDFKAMLHRTKATFIELNDNSWSLNTQPEGVSSDAKPNRKQVDGRDDSQAVHNEVHSEAYGTVHNKACSEPHNCGAQIATSDQTYSQARIQKPAARVARKNSEYYPAHALPERFKATQRRSIAVQKTAVKPRNRLSTRTSIMQKEPAAAPAQSRIRHNANYPKPWLDPPITQKSNAARRVARAGVSSSDESRLAASRSSRLPIHQLLPQRRMSQCTSVQHQLPPSTSQLPSRRVSRCSIYDKTQLNGANGVSRAYRPRRSMLTSQQRPAAKTLGRILEN